MPAHQHVYFGFRDRPRRNAKVSQTYRLETHSQDHVNILERKACLGIVGLVLHLVSFASGYVFIFVLGAQCKRHVYLFAGIYREYTKVLKKKSKGNEKKKFNLSENHPAEFQF